MEQPVSPETRENTIDYFKDNVPQLQGSQPGGPSSSPLDSPPTEQGNISSGTEDEQDAIADAPPVEKEPSSIALCRKVLVQLDADEEVNCCSICLDEFTEEDPTVDTKCG